MLSERDIFGEKASGGQQGAEQSMTCLRAGESRGSLISSEEMPYGDFRYRNLEDGGRALAGNSRETPHGGIPYHLSIS